jgi:hypothetical protein
MPRGDKSKYTGKQERKADHIAESYESRGVPDRGLSLAEALNTIQSNGILHPV